MIPEFPELPYRELIVRPYRWLGACGVLRTFSIVSDKFLERVGRFPEFGAEAVPYSHIALWPNRFVTSKQTADLPKHHPTLPDTATLTGLEAVADTDQ